MADFRLHSTILPSFLPLSLSLALALSLYLNSNHCFLISRALHTTFQLIRYVSVGSRVSIRATCKPHEHASSRLAHFVGLFC